MNDTIVNKDFHGIIAMLNERNDQINKHGYTAHNDVLYNQNGELVIAARALMKEVCVPHDFPEKWDKVIVNKMVLKPYIERLIIAGALLAAEVDRRRYIQKVMGMRKGTGKKVPPPHKYYPLTPEEDIKVNNEKPL